MIMDLDLDEFCKTIKESEVMYLATSVDNEVFIRPVSPLLVDEKTVCFYTANDSEKYQQMKANSQIAFCVGPMGAYQVKGTIRFLGSVFSEENKALNKQYRERYKGAFEISAPGETMENNEFVIVDISVVKGWIFDKENPEIPIGMGETHFA